MLIFDRREWLRGEEITKTKEAKMTVATTVTLFIDTNSTRQSARGYSDSGFDWGTGFTVTDDRDEATARAEEIEIELDEYGVAEQCGLCGELTGPLMLVAALRKYAAIREWLRDAGHISQDDYERDCDGGGWYDLESLDDSQLEDEHSRTCGNVGLFLETLSEVHGLECAVEQAKTLAKSKTGCPDAINWLASKVTA